MPQQAPAEPATLEARLENVVGPLADSVPHLVLDTIRHADQIATERRANPGLRNNWFYTADGALYTVEGDNAVLYLTRGSSNPILKNPQAAASQLLGAGNYIPSQEDTAAAISSPDTLKIVLSELGLQKHSDEFSYFEINTGKPDKLNPVQRKMAERVYGQGNDFSLNTDMLKGEGNISSTKIYVLDPEYVKQHAKDGNAISRACGLHLFGDVSIFCAYGRDVSLHGALRGVRREAAEGGTPEIGSIARAYHTILQNPTQALNGMTPEIASGLSGLVTQYQALKK